MEHSGVNPSAAGGCKVEDPLGPLTRSQVDVIYTDEDYKWDKNNIKFVAYTP